MMPSELEHWFEELQVQVKDIYRRLDRLQTLEDAMAQNYGWIGGAWQKDPLQVGYSDVLQSSYSNANLAGGSEAVTLFTVPAGEFWLVQSFVLAYVGTIPAATSIYIGSPTAYLYSWYGADLVSSRNKQVPGGPWTIGPGKSLFAGFDNSTAGDDFYAWVAGVRVDIDQ